MGVLLLFDHLNYDGRLLRHQSFSIRIIRMRGVGDPLLDVNFGVEGQILRIDGERFLFGVHCRNLMGVGVFLETD